MPGSSDISPLTRTWWQLSPCRQEPPVAFDHDCREGICGSCGFLINGVAHGGQRGTTVCQLSMRFFKDGDTLTLEPWRAQAFPVIRDLVVNRSAFDRIIQAGGFISAPTGSAPDANVTLVQKEDADTAFDAAAHIGCGACIAACPNASAMLFTSAKITHLNSLPQGQAQRDPRTLSMVIAMRETLLALSSYHWPGNIRELQNLIERAVILSNDGVLPNPLPTAATKTVVYSPTVATTLRDSERNLILHTLEDVGWVIGGRQGAASRLGLKRTTLIHKMKKLGITRPPREQRERFGASSVGDGFAAANVASATERCRA